MSVRRASLGEQKRSPRNASRLAGFFHRLLARLRGEFVRWIVEVKRLSERDLTVLVKFIEAEVLGDEFTERIGDVTRTPRTLTGQSDVDGERLEDQHQARLHETDHATEPALDVLGAGIAQITKDALDVAAPHEEGDPGRRSQVDLSLYSPPRATDTG